MGIEFLLYHLAFVSIVLLLTQSLNLIWRVNLFSLGHHGFFAVGAYATAIVMKVVLPEPPVWALLPWEHRLEGLVLLFSSVAIGSVIAGLVGFIMAGLFSRLRDDYFAVGTLVFAEVVQNIAANSQYVGGSFGFEVPYLVVSNVAAEQTVYVAFHSVILVAINIALYLALRCLQNSPYGLYIMALKDDEVGAELAGIDTTALRRVVFVLGTAIAGMAGGFFLHFSTLIVPADFSFINGLPIILYVVLGNLGISRCIVAAICVYTGYEMIKLKFFGIFGEAYGQMIGNWKEILLALLLVASITMPEIAARLRSRLIKLQGHG